MVTAAVDTTLRREVAMKTLLRPDRKAALESFIEEAQITGQLEHPNIVPLHELGHDPQGRPYIVMKKVHGTTLREVIDQSHRRPDAGETHSQREETGLLEIFLKVCDGVGYAHSRGVIHRDLKPDNIMVGEFGEVLVMDWGLGKPIGAPGNPEHDRQVVSDRRSEGLEITADGKVAGTPTYMAPEQAEGHVGELDERADIYALGGILYVILAGQGPYAGRGSATNLAELLTRVKDGDFVPPSDKTKHRRVPRELEAVVLTAMALEPDDRYATCAELAEDIRRYMAGRTLSVAEYSPFQLLIKWAKRNKIAVIGGASTAAALLIGVIVAIWLIARGEVEALRAAEEGRQQQMAAHRADAQKLFADASSRFATAEQAPFNPADPQAWFSATLPAWLDMGRALQSHDAPPAGWGTDVLGGADRLQTRALSVNNWALCRVVVKQLEAWGSAAPPDAIALRAAAIDAAEQQAIDSDRALLQSALERIAAAESGEGSERPARRVYLAPGELAERAREVSHGVRETTHVTAATLGALADPSVTPAGSLRRDFAIRVLGQCADSVTEVDGVSTPVLIRRELQRDPADTRADEMVRWIEAAALLQSNDPHAFGDSDSALDDMLARADTAWAGNSVVTTAVERSRDVVRLAGGGHLSSKRRDPGAFAMQVEWLSGFVASRVQSGSHYTSMLLQFAVQPDGSELSLPQELFLIEQLGLHGDTTPPDPAMPKCNAVEALMQRWKRLPMDWCRDYPPAGVERATWERRWREAIAAALNLGRLGVETIGRELDERRQKAGDTSPIFRSSELAAAVLGAQPAKVADPESASGQLARARALIAEGRWTEAVQPAEQAAALAPRDPDVWLLLGQVHAEAGRQVDALQDFSTAIECGAGAVAWANRAAVHQMLGQNDEALVDSEESVRRGAGDAQMWSRRAALLNDLGRLDDALQAADESVRLDPDEPMAFNNRGAIRHGLHDNDGALDDYRRALELDPGNPATWSNRGSVRLEQGDVKGAMDDYTRALELAPDDSTARYNRGNLRLKYDNDPAGAVEDYTHAIDAGTDRNDAVERCLFNRGLAYQKLGKHAEAADDFRRYAVLEPVFFDVWLQLGNSLVALGDWPGAADAYTKAIAIDPRNVAVISSRGAARSQMGDVAGAMADYDRALEIDPDHLETLHNRSEMRRGTGDINGALADAQRNVRLHPDAVQGHFDLGVALSMLRRLKEARDCFDRALEIEPDLAAAWAQRGVVRYQMGDADGGLADMMHSAQLQPRADTWIAIAQVREETGDTAGSLAGYEKALEIDHTAWLGWVRLAMLRAKTGDRSGARAAFEQALTFCPPEKRQAVINARRNLLGE